MSIRFYSKHVFFVAVFLALLPGISRAQSAPSFIAQPGNVTASDGGSFTVNVQVGTSNFADVTWKVNLPGRTLGAVSTASSQVNNFISASVSFGPVTASDAGNFQIIATNAYGSTLSAQRTLTVTPSAPSIITPPANQTVTVGGSVSYSVSAIGTGTLGYQWRKNDTVITGATSANLALSGVQFSDAGNYRVTVSNSVGSVTSNSASLTVNAAGVPPSVSVQPFGQTAMVGASTSFSVVATGSPPLSYQWRKDGLAIGGATSATLSLSGLQPNDIGNYTVVVSNASGSVTSSAASLAVSTPASAGRLVNLSVLTDLTPAGDSFTLGYVVGGPSTTGTKPLVIRAAGPSLGALGVGGTLDDPKLETFAGSTKTGENDNWGGSASLTAALAAVGAFPYTGPASKDAATSANIATRDNSVVVSSANNGRGLVIAEIYDATPIASFTPATTRLLNVSVRKHLGTWLTVGFVVGGATPVRVLIRAVGPTLGSFGVPGTVADPQLVLFNASSAKIGENNDWGGTADLTAAFAAVGAFSLPSTSKDAALVVTLQPGNYSVKVSGTGGTTGVSLVEVYEVP